MKMVARMAVVEAKLKWIEKLIYLNLLIVMGGNADKVLALIK